MADNIMTFRVVVKEVALEQGVRLVHAQALPEHPGSGMHTHVSLFEGDTNAFHEAGAPYQLSKTGRQFIAGLLHHGAEITAVTNQWVNSYKRLWGGGEAPAYLTWGHNNRSALVRVPMYKPDKGNSTRVEVRSLDSACNPYLALAVLLAAGLKGIEEGYELPPEAEDDVWSLTDSERRAMGIEPLPSASVAIWNSWSAASWSPRRWGSTSSTSSCATSGPNGGSTVSRSPSSSWTATSRGSRTVKKGSASWSIGPPALSP
jgi:glutamine synthetase